jgi:hypothetical protein
MGNLRTSWRATIRWYVLPGSKSTSRTSSVDTSSGSFGTASVSTEPCWYHIRGHMVKFHHSYRFLQKFMVNSCDNLAST